MDSLNQRYTNYTDQYVESGIKDLARWKLYNPFGTIQKVHFHRRDCVVIYVCRHKIWNDYFKYAFALHNAAKELKHVVHINVNGSVVHSLKPREGHLIEKINQEIMNLDYLNRYVKNNHGRVSETIDQKLQQDYQKLNDLGRTTGLIADQMNHQEYVEVKIMDRIINDSRELIQALKKLVEKK